MILVSEDSALTLDVKPEGLFRTQTAIAHSVNMIVSGHHDG
jgi:hypothetical protein